MTVTDHQDRFFRSMSPGLMADFETSVHQKSDLLTCSRFVFSTNGSSLFSVHLFSFFLFLCPLVTTCGFDLQRFSPLVTFLLAAKNTNHIETVVLGNKRLKNTIYSVVYQNKQESSETISLLDIKPLLFFKYVSFYLTLTKHPLHGLRFNCSGILEQYEITKAKIIHIIKNYIYSLSQKTFFISIIQI